jgi:hypothetical protein
MLRRLLLTALLSLPAFAQYNATAGVSAPTVDTVERVTRDAKGVEHREVVHQPVVKDVHGNARGSQHDLAIDGAFDGQTIVVLHFYTGGGFDFSLPKAALAEKGFSVYRFIDVAPSPKELEAALSKANQLWLISGDRRQLTQAHVAVIKKFFDAGHGLYLWGDNAPYAQDADLVSQALFDVPLVSSPHDQGEQVVGRQAKPSETGLLALKPLLVGTQKHIVAAYFDQQGKRAIVDGGFTRLYVAWDTAGTGRYVKNAAAWLANAERFGDAVVAKKK